MYIYISSCSPRRGNLCPREVILMPLLTCVSAVAPLRVLSVSPVGHEVPVCPHPSMCPSGHQALPSGIGPFFERSIDILRRPSAHAADASPACRQGSP